MHTHFRVSPTCHCHSAAIARARGYVGRVRRWRAGVLKVLLSSWTRYSPYRPSKHNIRPYLYPFFAVWFRKIHMFETRRKDLNGPPTQLTHFVANGDSMIDIRRRWTSLTAIGSISWDGYVYQSLLPSMQHSSSPIIMTWTPLQHIMKVHVELFFFSRSLVLRTVG